MRPKHAFFVGRSATRHFVGTAAWPADAIGTVWLRFPRLSRHRRRSWDSHPSQVCSRCRAAGASPRWPGPRAVGFTPPREQCPATVFVAADRAAFERQMSEKGGRSNEMRYVMRRLLGFDSRLRSAADGMRPAGAILPWAFRLSQVCRAHIRVRTRATARTIAPSPASATASAAAIRSWVSPAILPALREDLHRRLTPTRLFALRPLRPTSYTASRIAAIAGPFSVFEGLIPGRPATRRDCNRPTVRGRLPV
jgi:hypothetical protein